MSTHTIFGAHASAFMSLGAHTSTRICAFFCQETLYAGHSSIDYCDDDNIDDGDDEGTDMGTAPSSHSKAAHLFRPHQLHSEGERLIEEAHSPDSREESEDDDHMII